MPEPRKFKVNGIETEEEIITPQDIMNARCPMLTVDGVKRVSCTECHKRPLAIARLCQECYDEKIRVSEWRAKLGIVRRGKGKPKLTCPWCGHTERGWVPEGWLDTCCGYMKWALMEIMREEQSYERAKNKFRGDDWL